MSISTIIGMIVSAAAKNMKKTGEGERQAEKGYGIDTMLKQYPVGGMRFQQTPAIPSNTQSPTGNLTQMLTGIPLAAQKQVPTVGDALRGEETMLQNQNIPSIGGYMLQPQAFDSSRPFYPNPYSSRRFF